MSEGNQRGMLCPECGQKSGVEFTRSNVAGSMLRRKRRCPAGHIFRSVEIIETEPSEFGIRLVMKNGQLQVLLEKK